MKDFSTATRIPATACKSAFGSLHCFITCACFCFARLLKDGRLGLIDYGQVRSLIAIFQIISMQDALLLCPSI